MFALLAVGAASPAGTSVGASAKIAVSFSLRAENTSPRFGRSRLDGRGRLAGKTAAALRTVKGTGPGGMLPPGFEHIDVRGAAPDRGYGLDVTSGILRRARGVDTLMLAVRVRETDDPTCVVGSAAARGTVTLRRAPSARSSALAATLAICGHEHQWTKAQTKLTLRSTT